MVPVNCNNLHTYTCYSVHVCVLQETKIMSKLLPQLNMNNFHTTDYSVQLTFARCKFIPKTPTVAALHYAAEVTHLLDVQDTDQPCQPFTNRCHHILGYVGGKGKPS